MLAPKCNIISESEVGSPVYGKDFVDGMNTIYKSHLSMLILENINFLDEGVMTIICQFTPQHIQNTPV